MNFVKIISALILISLSSISAQATVDVTANVFIVQDMTEKDGENNFELRSVPASFCVGIFALNLADAVLKPVKIMENYGCGMPEFEVNINAGSCATVSSEEIWRDDKLTNEVDLAVDTKNCKISASLKTQFHHALRSAFEKTYSTNGYKINNLIIK